MKAIQIQEPQSNIEEAIRSLKVVDKPIPEPGPGQVLVKMAAAPCNPSDLLFLSGKYGIQKPYPAVPGWEGAGTVVKSGGGVLGWRLQGKRVACGGQSKLDGTWAEYYIAEAKTCVPLHDRVGFEQGATLLINPLTAVGMLEEAASGKHAALIQNAALSQVGRLLRKLASMDGVPVINIVRRSEQVEILRKEGAEHVLDSSDPSFAKELREMSHQLKATIAFDAVGGEMTGDMLSAMPEDSSIFVYGALSGQLCGGVSPYSLIFESKVVKGFWLSEWIQRKGAWHTFLSTRKVQQLMEDGAFQTKVRKRVAPEHWAEALLEYYRGMSGGKVLLRFDGDE